MLFDVRVTAFDPQASVDPVEALMRLFKIDRAFAREVVHRLPRVIKRGVPLETAQRLSQVLERIGASVEIIVAEKSAAAPQPNGAGAGGWDRQTLGGAQGLASALAAHGVPEQIGPHSAQAMGRSAAAASTARAAQSQPDQSALVLRQRASMQEHAAAQRAAHAGARQPMMSLPDPSLQEASPSLRAVGNAGDGRAMRALREPQPTTHEQPEDQGPFGRESLSENVRGYLRQSSADASLRASLPMGSWSEPAAEDSRVTSARSATQSNLSVARKEQAKEEPTRPSGADGGAESADLPSRGAAPAAKPSVKEILASRRSSQTAAGSERSSRASEESAQPGSRAEPLTLPTFHARGSSLGDEIDELPGTVELRRKLSMTTWLFLVVGALVTLGIAPLSMLLVSHSRSRRRALQLRTLQASSVLAGPSQLPELYACVKQLAIRLDLSPSPRLYVAERLPQKVQSFQVRKGLVMVLDAGFVGTCVRRDAGYVIQFALAHEMAAFVLGYGSGFRGYLARAWRKLHKAELLSADALASKLMADRNDAPRALASLLCGPELVHLVDLGELDRQTTSQEQEVSAVAASMEGGTYVLPRIQQLRRPLPSPSK